MGFLAIRQVEWVCNFIYTSGGSLLSYNLQQNHVSGYVTLFLNSYCGSVNLPDLYFIVRTLLSFIPFHPVGQYNRLSGRSAYQEIKNQAYVKKI